MAGLSRSREPGGGASAESLRTEKEPNNGASASAAGSSRGETPGTGIRRESMPSTSRGASSEIDADRHCTVHVVVCVCVHPDSTHARFALPFHVSDP